MIAAVLAPIVAAVVDTFGQAQGWLFQNIVHPVVYHLGFGEFTEEAFTSIIYKPLFSWPMKKPRAAITRWTPAGHPIGKRA